MFGPGDDIICIEEDGISLGEALLPITVVGQVYRCESVFPNRHLIGCTKAGRCDGTGIHLVDTNRTTHLYWQGTYCACAFTKYQPKASLMDKLMSAPKPEDDRDVPVKKRELVDA